MSPRKSDTAVDVCSNLLTILQQMQDVLSVAPFVPYLGLALSSAMGVVDVVKQMNLNQSRAKGIAQRVKDLKRMVSHTRHDEMEPLLKENIDELKSTLEDIHCDIEKQTKKTRLYRLVHVASISKKLDEHLEMLDYARQKFEVSSLIAMQQRMEYHASQARSQLADMFRHIRTRVDRYFNNLKTLFSRNFGSRCQGPGDGNGTSQEKREIVQDKPSAVPVSIPLPVTQYQCHDRSVTISSKWYKFWLRSGRPHSQHKQEAKPRAIKVPRRLWKISPKLHRDVNQI